MAALAGSVSLRGMVTSSGTLGAVQAAPSSLAAVATGPMSANLTWTDNSASETGFTLQIDTVATFDTVNLQEIGILTANTGGDKPATLTALTTYYARVRAYDATTYSAWSNTATFTTLSPPPTIVSATIPAAAATYIEVWSANVNSATPSRTLHGASGGTVIGALSSGNGTNTLTFVLSPTGAVVSTDVPTVDIGADAVEETIDATPNGAITGHAVVNDSSIAPSARTSRTRGRGRSRLPYLR